MSDVVNTQKPLEGVIDDGTREIPIKNKFGKLICNIYIRPGDFSILDRYEKFKKDLSNVVEPLKKLDNIRTDGTAEDGDNESMKALKEAEKNLNGALNYLFDMDEAQDIFKTRNPFSFVHGKFFCEIVIEAIGQIITQVVKEETELSQKRMSKYLTQSSDVMPTTYPEIMPIKEASDVMPTTYPETMPIKEASDDRSATD